ncbi:MAG: hypothetical protein QG593_724 [Patescibacteria group bacterium]|jgi:hypothetical protein|nr:hypothetical protein [Patescibacteria group bacterium]
MSKMQLFTTMCGKVKYIAVDKRILCWLDESHGSSMVFVNLRYTVYGIRYTVYGIMVPYGPAVWREIPH